MFTFVANPPNLANRGVHSLDSTATYLSAGGAGGAPQDV